jgi:murein DD-endopeptidase
MLSLAFLLLVAGLTACASSPPVTQSTGVQPRTTAPMASTVKPIPHSGLAIAREMIGAPYRYGGASPGGFDCSGLVYYSFREAGITVPRTSSQQFRQSERVELSGLQPGDLVFFRISRNKPSHVGIYAGSDRFIHAPSGGKQVSYASLNDPYWHSRVTGAGRF